MAFIQRLLSLGVVPLLALFALQICSPDTIRFLQYAIEPYIAGTPLNNLLPDALPPRSETPLIVTSVTHWSHFEKNAAIAIELAELGYPITFITGRVFEANVKELHSNIKFLPMHGKDDKLSEEDMATYLSLPSGVEQELFITKKVLVDDMPDGHNTLQEAFREHREKYGNEKPLISLYDQAYSGHQPIHLGAPGIKPDASIGISIAPLAIDSNDTFPFRSGKAPDRGPNAREVHRKAYETLFEDRFTRELNEYWWGKLREMGAIQDSYPTMLHAMNALPDYLLTLGVPEFEYPRSDLRPNVRYFGGFKKVGKQGDGEPQLPSWWGDFLQAKKDGKKVVAVSQGTVEVRPEDLVLPTLEALKDRDDVVVVATFVVSEPEDVPGLAVPKNAFVAKFVPYDLLLPLVDVLVSNGGYGAVQHCVRVGVPLVVAGEGQDKPTTNAIIDFTGVGINLGDRQPGAEKIGAAVTKILSEEKYKTKVQEISKQYEKYDVRREFDTIIRGVVREWKVKQTSW